MWDSFLSANLVGALRVNWSVWLNWQILYLDRLLRLFRSTWGILLALVVWPSIFPFWTFAMAHGLEIYLEDMYHFLVWSCEGISTMGRTSPTLLGPGMKQPLKLIYGFRITILALLVLQTCFEISFKTNDLICYRTNPLRTNSKCGISKYSPLASGCFLKTGTEILDPNLLALLNVLLGFSS